MFYRQRGSHKYNGKTNDRFKRFFSKLGIKKKDQKNLQQAFQLIEKENVRGTNAWRIYTFIDSKGY